MSRSEVSGDAVICPDCRVNAGEDHLPGCTVAAAAPELLERLREACEEIRELRRYANNHGGMFDDEQFDEGLVAISKAEGRP